MKFGTYFRRQYFSSDTSWKHCQLGLIRSVFNAIQTYRFSLEKWHKFSLLRWNLDTTFNRCISHETPVENTVNLDSWEMISVSFKPLGSLLKMGPTIALIRHIVYSWVRFRVLVALCCDIIYKSIIGIAETS